MHFGKKIVLFYLAFVALILTLVFLSYSQKVELVSKDYYTKELAYQKQIDAAKNAQAIQKDISFEFLPEKALIRMNHSVFKGNLHGEIIFYHVAESSNDVHVPLNLVNNEQEINTGTFKKGTYRVMLTWQDDEKQYYVEKLIALK